MDDARVRRDDPEVVEGLLAPAEEGVALAVALELELRVALKMAICEPKSSTCTEWSMTSSDGQKRIDAAWIAPQVAHRVAHGGEVDDGGNAGEVLQ